MCSSDLQAREAAPEAWLAEVQEAARQAGVEPEVWANKKWCAEVEAAAAQEGLRPADWIQECQIIDKAWGPRDHPKKSDERRTP